MEQAVWAPYGNEQYTTFVSKRVDFDKVYHHCCSTRITRPSPSSKPVVAIPTRAVDAPGEPVLPTGVPAEQIQGRSPWYLAWLRLRRNRVALAFGGVFIADRAVLPGGPAVGRSCGAHRAQ